MVGGRTAPPLRGGYRPGRAGNLTRQSRMGKIRLATQPKRITTYRIVPKTRSARRDRGIAACPLRVHDLVEGLSQNPSYWLRLHWEEFLIPVDHVVHSLSVEVSAAGPISRSGLTASVFTPDAPCETEVNWERALLPVKLSRGAVVFGYSSSEYLTQGKEAGAGGHG